MSTAALADSEQPTFEVIHEFHPLHRQCFELVDRRQTWGEDRVYYYDHHLRLRSLPARWTSAAAPNPYQVMAAGRSYFDPISLLELSRLIARLNGVED